MIVYSRWNRITRLGFHRKSPKLLMNSMAFPSVFFKNHLFTCCFFVRFKASHNFVVVCLEFTTRSFQRLADLHDWLSVWDSQYVFVSKVMISSFIFKMEWWTNWSHWWKWHFSWRWTCIRSFCPSLHFNSFSHYKSMEHKTVQCQVSSLKDLWSCSDWLFSLRISLN